MRIDPVTTRYVDALFALARRQGAVDAVRRDVERLAAELHKPEVGGIVFDARVSLESRRAKVTPMIAGAHPLVQNLVGLLFDKRRAEVLSGLGLAFHQRLLREEGVAEGQLESARPLGTVEIASVEAALGKRLGKRVTLESRITPELIGGLRAVVDNKMIDCSLQGRLFGLRKSMAEAPMHAGESD